MNASTEFVFFIANEPEMLSFGAKLGPYLQDGDCLALFGGLGAGKTTLTRGLIKALTSEDQDVPSPTYTLVQTYETMNAALWHFDLYRLDEPSEIIELGFEDALEDISIIEWPEKAGRYLPSDRLTIKIEPQNEGRVLTLIPETAEWTKRLHDYFGQS